MLGSLHSEEIEVALEPLAFFVEPAPLPPLEPSPAHDTEPLDLGDVDLEEMWDDCAVTVKETVDARLR
jgi:hypothetical protein